MKKPPRSRWIPVSGLTLFVPLSLSIMGCESQGAFELQGPDSRYDVITSEAPAQRALVAKSMFVASLSGPDAGVSTRGAGEASFRFLPDGESIQYRLNVANIQDVTMAHIHVAPNAGENGPPVVWLYPTAPPPALIPGRTQGSLGAGVFSATSLVGPMTGMSLDDLREAFVAGRAYVNVHTTRHPGGEIRGTIR